MKNRVTIKYKNGSPEYDILGWRNTENEIKEYFDCC